jgi:hypothetical protein
VKIRALQSLSRERAEWLISPFIVQEVEFAVKEMKTETALGSDGFPVPIYKKFRGLLKWWIM